MSLRAQYLIQILDKIGAPLMEAVTAARKPDSDDDVQGDAQIIASLLGKVVESSIAMNSALDLNTQDAQDDSLRVAMAALSGPLVAGQYKQNGKIPSEGDLKRIQTALQAVLTFGDNFTPSPEHAARLEKLPASGAPVDAHQINLQYVHAFIPVVNAVGAFSFGLPEQKLVMDISDRLVKRAVEMREALLPALSDDDQKLAELGILRALSVLYAAGHEGETKRLGALGDAAPEGSSMDPVWQGFDTRAAMLESLVKNVLPDGPAGSSAEPAPIAAAAVAAAPIEAPIAPAAAAQESPVAPPAAAPQAPPPTTPAAEPAQEQPAKPQIFGGGGDSGGGAEQPPAATPPPPPPAAPPAPPPVTPPAEPPPAAAPVVPETPAAPPQDDSAQAGGGPMSFFKAPGAEDPAAAPPPPPPPPPSPPPAAEPPPAAAPPVEQAPPPVQPPPVETPPAAPPPAETPDQAQGDSQGESQGGPMSFFTKKNEEE